MTPAQTARMRALMDRHDAVASVDLDDGLASLVARNAAGDVELVEVLDPDGEAIHRPQVALNAIAHKRRRAVRELEQTTDHALALVALHPNDTGSVALIARELGISRQTLYTRLESTRVATP